MNLVQHVVLQMGLMDYSELFIGLNCNILIFMRVLAFVNKQTKTQR